MNQLTKTAYESLPINLRVRRQLEHDIHPQERTRMFHEIFGAPIATETPDHTFSHMPDQRVAFRVSFILSEIFELIEKGLGLEVLFGVRDPHTEGSDTIIVGSSNGELNSAIEKSMTTRGSDGRNLIEVVDALGDLNVVVNGFAVELGIDMRAIDQEILASNLSKLGPDLNPIVSDGTDGHPAGKILKGPNYIEPQLEAVLGLD